MSNENAARNRFVLATPRPVRATESEGRGRRKDRRSMPAASGASHTAAQAMGSTQKTDSPRLHGWERRVFYTGCETQGQRIRAGGGLRWASGFADRADDRHFDTLRMAQFLLESAASDAKDPASGCDNNGVDPWPCDAGAPRFTAALANRQLAGC